MVQRRCLTVELFTTVLVVHGFLLMMLFGARTALKAVACEPLLAALA